ncbi:MAG: aminotransferase class I/II-fold pyridoxal phosphate-dependent enzyme [Bacteroidales bacterium]|nr:aminotransferase class I/II-fold pyridoxal phosphate-dependent enzyme [Bacteroidales bacterium]
MTPLLEQAYDPEIFRKQAHQLIDQITDHLTRCFSKTEPQVLQWRNPAELRDKWHKILSVEIDQNQFWEETIHDTIHLHHPRYMGHQVSPALPIAGLGELINGTLNNGSAIYEMGPVSSSMESVVIQWLAEAMGFNSDASGFLTSGGSLGNFTALLAARQVQSGYNHWREGLREGFHPAIMVSEEAHYSIARAVQMMGWGEQGLVKVPVNHNHQIDAQQLEPLLRKSLSEGKQVIILVGNACSTATGSYDPLEPMAEFATRHKLWFHVDGAHGAAAAITPKYRHLTTGIHYADSVVVDFHKMMGASALTTAVLFKDGANSYATFDQDAGYLLNHGGNDPWYDSAMRTVECTKNMMGIKIFAILKTYGPQFFIDYLTSCYDLGRTFAEIIKQTDDFDLATEPMSNIVCFRYHPENIPGDPQHEPDELNRMNRKIRRQLLESGKFYIVQTHIGEVSYLRTSLMNPFTTREDLTSLLDEIRKYGKKYTS